MIIFFWIETFIKGLQRFYNIFSQLFLGSNILQWIDWSEFFVHNGALKSLMPSSRITLNPSLIFRPHTLAHHFPLYPSIWSADSSEKNGSWLLEKQKLLKSEDRTFPHKDEEDLSFWSHHSDAYTTVGYVLFFILLLKNSKLLNCLNESNSKHLHSQSSISTGQTKQTVSTSVDVRRHAGIIPGERPSKTGGLCVWSSPCFSLASLQSPFVAFLLWSHWHLQSQMSGSLAPLHLVLQSQK